jgi:hypothetical protein
MPSSKKQPLDQVLVRASHDREFRARLLASPMQPLTEMLGAIPEGVRIRFIEKPADVDTLIVLPGFSESGELSAAELNAVAGGEGLRWDESPTEEDEPL